MVSCFCWGDSGLVLGFFWFVVGVVGSLCCGVGLFWWLVCWVWWVGWFVKLLVCRCWCFLVMGCLGIGCWFWLVVSWWWLGWVLRCCFFVLGVLFLLVCGCVWYRKLLWIGCWYVLLRWLFVVLVCWFGCLLLGWSGRICVVCWVLLRLRCWDWRSGFVGFGLIGLWCGWWCVGWVVCGCCWGRWWCCWRFFVYRFLVCYFWLLFGLWR